MADQKRSTAIGELVTLLDSVAGTPAVYDVLKHVSTLAEDEFPAILLVEGRDQIHRSISPDIEIELKIGMMIFYKDDEDTARDLEDVMISKIEGAAVGLLNDSVLNIQTDNSNEPFTYPDLGTKFRGRVITIMYRRDLS